MIPMLRSRPETSLGQPVIDLLKCELFGFEQFAQERCIILAGQTVSLDLIAHGPEKYLACELKRYLSPEVIEQAIRWLDHANLVCIAVEEPHNQSKAHQIRRDQLARIGVGLFYVQGDIASVVIPPVWRDSNTRLLEKALAQSDGAIDPPAGSKSGKRVNETRAQWEPLRRWLDGVRRDFIKYGEPSISHDWKTCRFFVPEMRRITAAQCRRAIDRGDCIGVGYRGTAITEFFAEDKK